MWLGFLIWTIHIMENLSGLGRVWQRRHYNELCGLHSSRREGWGEGERPQRYLVFPRSNLHSTAHYSPHSYPRMHSSFLPGFCNSCCHTHLPGRRGRRRQSGALVGTLPISPGGTDPFVHLPTRGSPTGHSSTVDYNQGQLPRVGSHAPA